MKKLLGFLFLISSVSQATSTTSVPMDGGLKQVYVTDQFGNGLLDQASSQPALSVSLGSSVAKSQVMRTGVSVLSATTHTTPLVYTTSTGKVFYVTYFEIDGRLSVASGTVSGLGQCSLEIPLGTSVATFNLTNATHGGIDRVFVSPAEPIVATSGQVVGITCDPGTSTSTIYRGNFGGYEK